MMKSNEKGYYTTYEGKAFSYIPVLQYNFLGSIRNIFRKTVLLPILLLIAYYICS